jgi:hypothetical protein
MTAVACRTVLPDGNAAQGYAVFVA